VGLWVGGFGWWSGRDRAFEGRRRWCLQLWVGCLSALVVPDVGVFYCCSRRVGLGGALVVVGEVGCALKAFGCDVV